MSIFLVWLYIYLTIRLPLQPPPTGAILMPHAAFWKSTTKGMAYGAVFLSLYLCVFLGSLFIGENAFYQADVGLVAICCVLIASLTLSVYPSSPRFSSVSREMPASSPYGDSPCVFFASPQTINLSRAENRGFSPQKTSIPNIYIAAGNSLAHLKFPHIPLSPQFTQTEADALSVSDAAAHAIHQLNSTKIELQKTRDMLDAAILSKSTIEQQLTQMTAALSVFTQKKSATKEPDQIPPPSRSLGI